MMTQDDLIRRIEGLTNDFARRAQEVYDAWNQIDGYSDVYGSGGICDDIADEMVDVLIRNGIDAFTHFFDHESHRAAMAYDPDIEGPFEGEMGVLLRVDIRPWHYEEGGGYTWRKIPNVVFQPRMVTIEDYSDVYNQYLDFDSW